MLNVRFVSAVLLVASAFVLCAGGNWLTKSIETELLDATLKINPAQNAEAIENEVQEIVNLWNEKERILTLFVDHERCDELGNYVVQIKHYANFEDYDSLTLACLQLSALLDEMILQEKISIYNLL